MEKHYLTPLFAPESVAVVGASERQGSAGRIVMENIAKGGYGGEVFPVNPNHATVLGKGAYASVEDIPRPVDLAVIATPAVTVPGIIEACGKKGLRGAVIISSGFGDSGPKGKALLRAALGHARAYGVRLLGPGCLGVIRPAGNLNASYCSVGAKAGGIALISQSAALCNAVLDWANVADVRFSSVINLGDGCDVTFGESLDYLVWDQHTESILLYLEGVYDARRFLSALRAAARVKPVIVVKTGRDPAGQKAAITHSGAMVGTDDVFEAALRRCGAVRVKTFVQLFSAARCLTARFRPCGNRLAIVTNGGGPGIIAADWAADVGIRVPELSIETIQRLDETLPPDWSRANPIDMCGDATPEHYRAAVTACMEDKAVDGVLVILTPQAKTHADDVARVVIELADRHKKPLITCWMGESQVAASRQAFTRAKIATFRTPEPAVEAFSHITAHYVNQRLLMQVPYSTSFEQKPDLEGARYLIETALAEKRKVLNEMESKALLAAFHIPVANTVIARSPAEAVVIAEQTGFPVAMKINSPDIAHKSEVDGVKLNVANAQQVRSAYNEIIAEVGGHMPGAQLDGVAIQPMSNKPRGRELLVGITNDSVFGPVITFGAGGVTVEVMGDRAVALPPLNPFLARDMIARTRVSKMLGAFHHMPPVDLEALESVLLRVSEMACELPWIKELDINPLIVDEHGAVAVDARMAVDYLPLRASDPYAHMAIHPYPSNLEQQWQLADGTGITIRPVKPEDAEMMQEFVHGLSEESRYFRFISTLHELSQKMLVRFTQIDYDREMALMGVTREGDRDVELGAARYAINPDGESCEFALVVGDAWQGKGIGSKLMLSLMDVARAKGLRTIEGDVLSNNAKMLKLMTTLGFAVHINEEDPSLKRVVKAL